MLHRDLQQYGLAVRLARREAGMNDLEGMMKALALVERIVSSICYRTGLTPAELKRQLDEAEEWAEIQ